MIVFYLISSDFCTSLLTLHEHLVMVVGKSVGTFARPSLSTLSPRLIYSHTTNQNHFGFFLRSVKSLCVSCFKIGFFFMEGSSLFSLLHKHYNCITIYHFSNFQPWNSFFGDLLAKETQFPEFLEDKTMYLWVPSLQ